MCTRRKENKLKMASSSPHYGREDHLSLPDPGQSTTEIPPPTQTRYDFFTHLYQSLPLELVEAIEDATVEVLDAELQLRAKGDYDLEMKPTVLYIVDTMDTLSVLGGQPAETVSGDANQRIMAVMKQVSRHTWHFRSLDHFLQLHLKFVQRVPWTNVCITITRAEAETFAHERCFFMFHPEKEEDEWTTGWGCNLCHLRQLLDVAVMGGGYVHEPVRRSPRSGWRDPEAFTTWSQGALFGIGGVWDFGDWRGARNAAREAAYAGLLVPAIQESLTTRDYADLSRPHVRGLEQAVIGPLTPGGSAGPDQILFSLEGPLGRLEWAAFGKTKLFGALVPGEVLRPSQPRRLSESGRKLRQLIRGVVFVKLVKQLESNWPPCTCGQGWFGCTVKHYREWLAEFSDESP
ncbi:hypothetical protein LTR62_002344 [Meristemomyces frigidus]|uniref:Uncharacterized protein n=1 Tax=Meristemomyces frigidus TaxID=1508187 RepID=A0AAN7T7J1_9PEZI|nr:hypothetical protein LTR62_002344 [Meristemomyces frigidus]